MTSNFQVSWFRQQSGVLASRMPLSHLVGIHAHATGISRQGDKSSAELIGTISRNMSLHFLGVSSIKIGRVLAVYVVL